MAAIFYFRHTQTSDSFASCLFVLPHSENMGISVAISFLCCLKADIEVYPALEAAISDFFLRVKSYNVPGIVLLDRRT